MLKSVQTHRLSVPHGLNLEQSTCKVPSRDCRGPSPPAARLLSRTGSTLSNSSSRSHHRLSCALGDELRLSLSSPPSSLLSFSLPAVPVPGPGPDVRDIGLEDDPVYEEICTASRSQQVSRTEGFKTEPPRLAPVSGVLHNKSPVMIRPLAFKPYIRPASVTSASLVNVPSTASTPLLCQNSVASPATPQNVVPARQPEMVSWPETKEALLLQAAKRVPGSVRLIGKSLSDPWKARPYRKLLSLNDSNGHDLKMCSTPGSVSAREESTAVQHLYYPCSISEKSSASYGYISGSDRSVESLYGTDRIYRARMITADEEEDLIGDEGYQMNATPSPSDSGIAVNYEALLRQRDGEILALRTTMERNEAVIFKVHQEKEAMWQKKYDILSRQHDKQLQDLKVNHQSQLGEATKGGDVLREQNLKLRQQLTTAMDCKKQMETLLEEKEKQVKNVEVRLEEAKWEVCEKTGQMSLIKKMRTCQPTTDLMCQQVANLQHKLQVAQKDAFQRTIELQDLRQTLNFLSQELYQVQQKFDLAREELEQKNTTLPKRNSLVPDSDELVCLRKELSELRLQREQDKEQMEVERTKWQEEKEKVLRYQRQLQHNHFHLYRLNCSLQSQLNDIESPLIIGESSVHDSVRESDC